MSLLLRRCDILKTENDSFVTVKNGYLGIEGSRIDYISDLPPQKQYDTVKDMPGKLLMPGLINCHGHSAMTLLRGVGSDLSLHDWLEREMFPVEDRMTREDIHAGRSLAMLEMIRTGTTTFSDMYMFPEDAAELCGKAGMKGHFSRVMQEFDPAITYEANGRGPLNNRIFEKYNGSFDDRVRIDYMIHAEYTCFPELVRQYVQDAKERGALVHTHISETKKEHDECLARHGKTPLRWFADLGAFDTPAYTAHCVWVSADDISLMREKGISCIHCPTSNMKIGSGFAPIPQMLEAGVNVALGTDGAASNNNLNMFEEMHIAAIIHNGRTLDPTVMKAEQVLKMATVNGARALRREDTGSLETGKKADIIALDLSAPHLVPNLDTVSLIVYAAQGSDVCMTMADGRILYEDGAFLTLDKDEIFRQAAESIKRLYRKKSGH